MPKRKITIEVDKVRYRLLQVLTCGPYAPPSVEEVVGQLVDHAQQGVYRPGAWERAWLCQAFGDRLSKTSKWRTVSLKRSSADRSMNCNRRRGACSCS